MRWSRRPHAIARLAPFTAALACVCTTLLSGCNMRLETPVARGELVVAIRKTPAYYQDEDGRVTGFEHDLVELFGRELGVPTRFVLAHDHGDLIQLVKQGKVHFAAAAPVVADAGLRYSSPLRDSGQVVVQHAETAPIKDLSDLAGKTIEVLSDSPQEAALQGEEQTRPPLRILAKRNMGEIELLERVSQKKSEFAATDTTHFRIAMNYFPELEEALELDGKVRFAWAFVKDGDAALLEQAQIFIARAYKDGTLARIHDRYFGHLHRINSDGVASFLERVGVVLPRYRAEFISAQELTGIDWRLLAALAYQESRWDPLATSPTGVRGMMMLTEETADRLRVRNRLEARQSIRAGARYLADILAQLPPSVREPDRTWLALAAYNLGQGHMNGARAIALGMKRDPDSWLEMKKVLPLLARQQYYERLKSGRARGGEAVIMVENVRTFFDILSRFEPAHGPTSYAPPIFSMPPMYERNDPGTVTLPLPF